MATDRSHSEETAPKRTPPPFWTVNLAFVGAALTAVAVFAGIYLLAELSEPGSGLTPSIAFTALGLALGAALVLLWVTVGRALVRPTAWLADETQFIAEANADRLIDPQRYPTLSPLPEAINGLIRRLLSAKREVSRAVGQATSRVEEEKSRLEALLRDLREGVLVCNLEHRILLYNQAALSVLNLSGELGLGRSLFNLVTREPVLHALERLTHRPVEELPDATASMVLATADSRTLLSGRMSLVLDQRRKPSGYVITFSDVTREVAELARRDALLRNATEGLRAPLANLRAAAETLASFPDMEPDQRRAFNRVILREWEVLSEKLQGLDHDYRSLGSIHWPMADVHSVDLLNCVIRRLADSGGPAVTMVGIPLWLHADSFALVMAIEFLVRHLAEETGVRAFDIEALLGNRRVYIEISWDGAHVPSPRLDTWLATPLADALGAPTLREVLERHASEIWSRGERDGRAMLRLPLPASRRASVGSGTPHRELPRPEFYDFDLLHLAPAGEQLGSRPLRALTYVVFDLETTGLSPAMGDEIVSIGAVRVVNGRILTGETFDRLVNPKRPIPKESTRFHGITDERIADAPPLEVVLPQFRTFAADAILIAHNAAFDLTFLRRRESDAGVTFDNLALDTMLISAFLYPDMPDHSLDSLTARLGIEIIDRHSALGDTLATAAVFVRLLDLLEQRDIVTFDALIRASNMMLEIKARARRFGPRPFAPGMG